jgi:hypothetical protein
MIDHLIRSGLAFVQEFSNRSIDVQLVKGQFLIADSATLVLSRHSCRSASAICANAQHLFKQPFRSFKPFQYKQIMMKMSQFMFRSI